MLSLIRSLLGLCVACGVAGLALGLGHSAAAADAPPLREPILADYDVAGLTLGGDFALTNQYGKHTRTKDFRGRVVVLFFGYTYCPDVCPAAMVKIARVRKGLGPQGKKVLPVFVSVDPVRDTPARLKSYLENFDAAAVGLTGTAAEVARATKLYRVRFEREDSKSTTEYAVSHTAFMYLVDRQGMLRYVMPPDVEDRLLAEGTRRLLRD